MASTDSQIRSFWQWFGEHQAEFKALSHADEPFWDVALQELKKVDERLWMELSGADNKEREFIVTALGDTDAFPIAEEVVHAAPAAEGWVFIALKPAMGFDFTTNYEGTVFDPQEMWFLPMESDSRPLDLGLRIGIPGLKAGSESKAHYAACIILDTALGERSAALDIWRIEVWELPPNPEEEGYIELPELAGYIAWRKRKLASQVQ